MLLLQKTRLPRRSVPALIMTLMVAIVLMATFMSAPSRVESRIIKIRKKKIFQAAQAASALAILRKPKKVVFPLPVPLPLPIPIITKHDPVIHPIDPLQFLAFEKGLALSGLGGLPGGFSTYG